MRFLPVIELILTHSYYTDARCPDFRIDPTPATQRLLANHRCVIKPQTNGIRILTVVTAADIPLLPLPPDTTLTFFLRLRDADFALFTDLTEFSALHAPLFTNVGRRADDTMPLALVSRVDQAIEPLLVQHPSQTERFALSRRPLAGTEATDFVVDNLPAVSRISQYDASTPSIAVNTSAAQPGDRFTVAYAVAPHRERGVFAEIELHYIDPPASLGGGVRTFHLTFTAKRVRWQYYVVTDLADTDSTLQIIDTTTSPETAPLVFGFHNRTDLAQDPDPHDTVAATLAAHYPTLHRFRFRSDDLIPCQQAARKHLQLQLHGTQIVTPLPNPSFRRYTPVTVTVDGSPQRQEALFHIVRHVTHPLPTMES